MIKNNYTYNICPICSSKMTSDWYKKSMVINKDKIDYVYACSSKPNEHYFTQKVSSDLKILEMQACFSESSSDQRLFIKIDFGKNTTDMWLRDEFAPRHTFKKIIIPNFADQESVKLKIKTYLTFL